MSKTARRILIAAVVIILTIGWFWRYISLNAYYDSIAPDRDHACYGIGDIVPFEDDRMSGGGALAEGYSIRVDDFEILEYTDLDPEDFAESDASRRDAPVRIALVHITLFNEDSDAQGIMLTDLMLYGIDALANMDWSLLTALNPVLEGRYGVRLSPGTELSLVIPYDMYQDVFPAAWNHLESYPLYLYLTYFPTEKEIRVQ